MREYEIHFSQVVTQREDNVAYVMANSEEEAFQKLKDGDYYNFDTFDISVIKTGDFEDVEIIKVIEDDDLSS
jgi:hypothetical protein